MQLRFIRSARTAADKRTGRSGYIRSSRQGHFSPSLSQNRAWDSHLTRLFSFSIRRFLYTIELNLIVPRLLRVVFLSTNERAEPFAPPSLQRYQHYYDSVRHSTTLRFPLEYLEFRLYRKAYMHIVVVVSHVPYKSLHKIPAASIPVDL